MTEHGPPAGMDWRSMTAADSPKGLPDVYDDPHLTDLRTPDVRPDGPAADFELPVYDFSSGTKRATGTTMHLADVASQRPVALIFGSYT